jgi:acyl carrier protein
MEIAETFRSFITTNFYVADPAALSDDDSLLDAGIIDSTGVLDLIGFIEQQFGVTVADEELVPENLDSITRLTAFLERKHQAAAPSTLAIGL